MNANHPIASNPVLDIILLCVRWYLRYPMYARRDALRAKRFFHKTLKSAHNQCPRVINTDNMKQLLECQSSNLEWEGTYTSKIKEDLMIHAKGEGSTQGSPGAHVGTVDHMDGENYIKLNKKDSDGSTTGYP